MNRECWRTVFFLVVLIFFTLFVRIVFLQPNAEFIELQADYYQKAMIGSQGVYKLHGFGIDEWYTKILSVCMLFFGNSKVAGLYLNIILQVLTVVCIYFAMGFVSNVQVSVLVSGVILLIPFYSDKVYEISSFNLLLLLCAIGFLALAGLCKGVAMFIFKRKSIEQEHAVPCELQEEQTGVITLDDIVGDIDSSTNIDDDKQKELVQEQVDTEALPAGMKEIVFGDDGLKKNVKLIENPLPIPKKREHKEMDFAVVLHNNNDDYDLKDVSGMDYFDIE